MIDQLIWENAKRIVKERGYSVNYPNIYAVYVSIWEKPCIIQRLLNFSKSRTYPNAAFTQNHLSLDEQISKVNRLVENVSREKSFTCELERRDLLIEQIRDALSEFVTLQNPCALGVLIEQKSGESNIYVDEVNNVVYKSRDIFAHDIYKPHNPWYNFYEHIIHSVIFPSTNLEFIGVSVRNGVPSLLLKQTYFRDLRPASDKEISSYMTSHGFKLENRYYWANYYIRITDLFGKNVLKADGKNLYFIDTNIYFKRPINEVLRFYSLNDSTFFSI